MRRLLSTLFWLFLVTSSIALFPIALAIRVVTAPFDPQLRALHLFTCFWASIYSWLNPMWPVTIEGRERIRPGVAYVFVVNHQSLLDILVLFRLFTHFKWVSKVENFRIVCVGWNMRLNRYIEIRRGDSASAGQMMQKCEATLRAGNPIMMFPEGTRSVDGRLRPFKLGAFVLAQRAHVPILPILIEGTGNALPKRGFVLQGKHPIRIRVLDEIPPESFANQSADALMADVRAIFTRELGEVAVDVEKPLMSAH